MNRTELLEQGVKLYPGRHHTEFYRAFTETPESFIRYYRSWNKDPRQESLRNELKNYFLANKDIDHLVSSEDISLLSASAFSALKTFLREECGFLKITVICFLREPLDYLNSSLQQHIKLGLITFDEMTKNTLHSYRLEGCPGFSGGLQNVLSQLYFSIPQKLVEAFGEENVKFIKFETAIRTGLVRSVVENFKDGDRLQLQDAKPSNASISHEACLLLAEYNNRNPFLIENNYNEKRSKRINLIIRSIAGKSPRLINPSYLDFEKINTEISQVNSIAKFNVLTLIHELPEKYRNKPLLAFSRESVAFLDTLIDMSHFQISDNGEIHDTRQLTETNQLLEKKHRSRWRSKLNKYFRATINWFDRSPHAK